MSRQQKTGTIGDYVMEVVGCAILCASRWQNAIDCEDRAEECRLSALGLALEAELVRVAKLPRMG